MRKLICGFVPGTLSALLVCACFAMSASASSGSDTTKSAGVFSWTRNGTYADAVLSNTSGSTRWLEVGVSGTTKSGQNAGSATNSGSIPSGYGSIWAGTSSLSSDVYWVEHWGLMRNSNSSTSGVYEPWSVTTTS